MKKITGRRAPKPMELPKSLPEIGQFGPAKGNPAHYPGMYGWGYDIGNYRIVMFGPPEWDHKEIRTVYEKPTHPILEPKQPSSRVVRTRDKQKQKNCTNGYDHPPAHIHVFNLANRHESRFELLEHYKRGQHKARLLKNDAKRENALSWKEIIEIQPVLDAVAEPFIQQWREMYQADSLSRYVTRVVPGHSQDMEEVTEKGTGRLARRPFSMQEDADSGPPPSRSHDGYRNGRGNHRGRSR